MATSKYTPKSYIGTASDYADVAKQYKLEGEEQNLWEQYLTGIRGGYASAQAAETASAQYDISKAYANYKRQQLAVAQNRQLFTGYKEDVSSALRSQYESTYGQIQSQLGARLSTLSQQQAQAEQGLEEQFAELGTTAQTLQSVGLEYMMRNQLAGLEEGALYKKDASGNILTDEEGNPIIDASILKQATTEGGLGWYEASTDESGRETLTQTALGQKAWGELLSSGEFAEYLRSSKPELYEKLSQNPQLYAELVGGEGATTYKASEHEQDIIEARRKEVSNYMKSKGIEISDAVSELYGKSLEKLTPEDAMNVAKNLERTGGSYVASAVTKATDYKTGVISTVNDQKFGISDNQEYQFIDNKNKYKPNDIIYINGEYRYITSSLGKGKYYYYVVDKDVSKAKPIADLGWVSSYTPEKRQ